MEEKQINKALKVKKTYLIISLVILAIGVALLGGSFYLNSGIGKEAKDFHELIYNYEDKEGEYAKVTAAYLPFGFAVEDLSNGGELNYYIIMDSEGYMYIARLTDKTYEAMEKQKEEQGDNFSYEITGYLFKIPNDLKKLAISGYNEAMEEKVLTTSNFEEYMGSVYLDETITPDSDTGNTLMGIAVIAFMLGFALLIPYIIYIVKASKVDKTRLEEAREELKSTSAKAYPKQSIYLTDKYVISNYNGLYVLEYKEILWVYNLINYYRGTAMGKTLMAYTSDNKRIGIGYTGNVSNQTIEGIMAEIQAKNPTLRIGYTDDNITYFKNYKKGKI